MADMVISVQHVELNASSAATVSGVLIYGQDTSNCVPFVTAHCAGADDIREGFFDVYFGVESATGSGTINCEFFENSGNNKHIHAYIVEFDPAQVKVQQGTFNMTATTIDDVTLSGVGLDNVDDGYAAMTHYYQSSTDTDSWTHHCVRSRITSSGTNVQFERGGASGNINGHYYLFEALNNQFSVQGELIGDMSGVVTAYQAINWVNWAQSFILSSYHTTAGNNCQQGTARMSLMTPTEIQISRTSATNNIWWSFYVITFNSNRKHVQRWFSSFGTTETVLTADLDYSVDLDYSISSLHNHSGIQRHSGTATTDPDAAFYSVKFNSSSQIEVERNSTGSSQLGYSTWQVIDWQGVTMVSGTNPSPLNPSYSCVKSVERVTLNIDNYYIDDELTLGQDVTNCIPFLSHRGSNGPGDFQWALQHDVWFTAPSLVSARRRQSTGNLIIEANVVEFYPNQVRIQQGVLEITDGDNEELVTISSVDQTKAVLIFNGANDSSSTGWNNHLVRGRFSSDTQLQFYRGGTTGDWEGHYYIFEDLADNFEVESALESFGSSANMAALFENELKYNNSFIIYSYYVNTTGDDMDKSTIAAFWNDIYRMYGHRQTATNDVWVSAQVVRFLDDRLHTYIDYNFLRHALGTGDTTYSGTLPSYYEGRDDSLIAFCSDCGGTGAVYTTNAAGISEVAATITLRDSSYWYNIQRNAVGYTGYYPFTIIDWVGYKPTLPAPSIATQSFVRSITQKTVSLVNGELTQRYYIGYIDNGQLPANCVPLVTMRATGTSGEHRDIIPSVLIYTDGSNQIHVHRAGSSGSLEVNIYIVEFDPSQVKVQSGSFYMTGTSVTKYIEDVDLNKAFVISSCCCPSADAGWDTHMVRTRFTSVSGIEISRYNDPTGNDAMFFGYYYVVEALGDQFTVHDITFPNNDDSNTLYATYPNHRLDTSRTMFIISYTHKRSSNIPADAAYRYYHFSDNRVVLNKESAGGQLNWVTAYGIEFNENIGVRILDKYADSLTGSETSIAHTFHPDEAFDTTRSIVHNPIVQNTARNNDTVASATEAGFHRMYFNTASGTGVTTDRYATSTPTTSPSFQVIEFPAYKTHYFEGVVQEEGSEVAREVVAYRADTYEIMNSTISTVGTGAYYLETSYSGTHYIVCLDNTDTPNYNDLILGKMVPTPIT